MNTEQQWQEIKETYLKLIKKSLAQVDHPQRGEILSNVRDHLDNKYAELNPEQQTREAYQQIITEMGPPEEYAELLTEEKTPVAKKRFGINELLAIVFIATFMVIGIYLINNAQQPKIGKTILEFELDEQVLGQWTTVDFVKTVDDFDPTRKNWQGELFLKKLTFEKDGGLWCENSNVRSYKRHWTKGKAGPDQERPAFYYLKTVDGQTYLFYEWISGDVTDRGRAPSHYVLKRSSDDDSAAPDWFENDPQVIGHWKTIDYVNEINDFKPTQNTGMSDVFLKTVRFQNNGKLWWTLRDSQPIELDWTNGKIRPFGMWPATYVTKEFDEMTYLFFEWKSKDHNQSSYYVLIKTAQNDVMQRDIPDESFELDPQVLGQWTTIDFVETRGQFQPHQKSWLASLFLKKLHFKKQGLAEWTLGEDNEMLKKQWTRGKLNPDEPFPGLYTLQTMDGNDYLFIEWISGDVTIRGRRPCYYVLQKAE